MDELGELGNGFDEMRRDELLDPLGRLLAHLSLQLDLENTIREELLVVVLELLERPVDTDVVATPVVARACLTVPVVLADERELGVEGDTDASVAGKLEGGSVVEGAHHFVDGGESAGAYEEKRRRLTRLQLLVLYRRLHLPRELDHAVDLLVALLTLRPDRLEGLVHRELAREVVVDVLLRDREPLLDRLLSRPVLAVGFALDEDLLDVRVAVPAKTDGLGALGLLQTTHIQVKVLVVEVDGRDGGVRLSERLVGVEDEDGEMLEDDELELDVVVGVDLRGRVRSVSAFQRRRGEERTQYLVVCLTKAAWLPPALESPMTGLPRVRTRL